MTGLERLVRILFGSHNVLRRYLTLLYGFTLGLALVLAILAISQRGNIKPNTNTITQKETLPNTPFPTPDDTLAQGRLTPSPLPAIPHTPNVKTPSNLSVTASELNGVKVNLWHPWTGSTGELLQTILDEYNRTNQWGITVQSRAFEGYGNLDDALESAISLGSMPDIWVDYGYQTQHWDKNAVVVDLNPYVSDPVWGMTIDEQADFNPSFWAEDLVTLQNTNSTRRLGIPFYRSAYLLFYNQSWAKELGFHNPPNTPNDFRLQSCTASVSIGALGDKSSLGKGGWLITPQPGALVGWIYAFGGGITNPNALGYLFDTPETKMAFEYLNSLQESGCAWSDSGVDPQSEFTNRHALFVVQSMFDITNQQKAFAQAASTDQWVVIPFPSFTHPVIDTYGPSLSITRTTSPEQLAAWLVVKWLVYPPNQAKLVRALGASPTRQSTLQYLNDTANNNPQWKEALELLPYARGEPSLASWSVTRWALNDVMTQLMNPQLSVDQIPLLLESLDNVASDIFNQVR